MTFDRASSAPSCVFLNLISSRFSIIRFFSHKHIFSCPAAGLNPSRHQRGRRMWYHPASQTSCSMSLSLLSTWRKAFSNQKFSVPLLSHNWSTTSCRNSLLPETSMIVLIPLRSSPRGFPSTRLLILGCAPHHFAANIGLAVRAVRLRCGNNFGSKFAPSKDLQHPLEITNVEKKFTNSKASLGTRQ